MSTKPDTNPAPENQPAAPDAPATSLPATESPPAGEPAKPADMFQRFVDDPERTERVLLTGGIIAVAMGAWVLLRYSQEQMPVILWAMFLGVVWCGGWLHMRSRSADQKTPDLVRQVILAVGGLTGVLTWVFSLYLLVMWWDTFVGGLDVWLDKPRDVWLFLLAYLGSLGLTFLSLLLARSKEQDSVVLRRLLYGFNAVLTGQLLLFLVLVANILVANQLAGKLDWTEGQILSLSQQSENILRSMRSEDRRVQVVVLMSERDPSFHDVRRLLANCRQFDDRLQVSYLVPDRQIPEFQEVKSEFPLVERGDILVIAGTDKNQSSQIIKHNDLTEPSGAADKPRFKGEDALMAAFKSLSDTKGKIVYFLQGDGEFPITPGGRGGSARPPAAALARKLGQDGYDVRSLKLDSAPVDGGTADPKNVTANRVPADASILVIVGPDRPVETVNALDEYMARPGDKQGKVIVMFDADVPRDGKRPVTGLEEWVAKYGVIVENNRILSFDPRFPEKVAAITPLVESENPVVKAFALNNPARTGTMFVLDGGRTVKPAAPPPPAYHTEVLLTTPDSSVGLTNFVEPSLTAPAAEVVKEIRGDRKKLREKAAQPSSPLAVAVSDKKPPQAPVGPMTPPSADAGKPRMIVFGNATMITDDAIQEGRSGNQYDLFTSCLAWLRERPETIGVPAKDTKSYNPSPDVPIYVTMVLLPPFLIFVAILGLGTGMWLIRSDPR